MITIYLGYNSFKIHKRGVENVIDFQSLGSITNRNIYIHWDDKNNVGKYNNFITIGIKKDIWWAFRLNILLVLLRKKYKALLIHSHNPLMSLILLCKSTLFTVHDALYYLTKARGYKFSFIYLFLENLLYRRVKFVHFISQYSKNNSLYRGNNFRIIHNTSHFENVCGGHFKDGIHTDFPTSTIDILIVRSIEERARIDLVLELSKIYTGSNFRFIFSGKGPLLEYYKSYVKEHQLLNVLFLGYTDDSSLLNLYDNAKLVIVPAEYGEGFGLPIIEGYLFNKPVIASNVCAIPEIIISDEYLFENNICDLNQKFNYALRANSTNFKDFYDLRFSNNKIVENFKILYFDMIKWKFI